MLVIYPAIFHKAIEGGYVVEFPDLNNGATQGETLEEAVEAAQDYIGTWLYDDFVKGNAIPKATDISEIQITDNDFITALSAVKGFAIRNKFGTIRQNNGNRIFGIFTSRKHTARERCDKKEFFHTRLL